MKAEIRVAVVVGVDGKYAACQIDEDVPQGEAFSNCYECGFEYPVKEYVLTAIVDTAETTIVDADAKPIAGE